MKFKSESEEKIEKIFSDIEAHPLSLKFKAEKAAEILGKRKKAAGKIKALEKEQAGTIPRLQKDLAEAEAQFKAAQEAVASAAAAVNTARASLSCRSLQFENSIGRQQEILFSTCDPPLDAAIEFFNKKLDFLRTPGRISSQKMGALRNIFSMSKTTKEESNLQAVNSALVFCQSAIKVFCKCEVMGEY